MADIMGNISIPGFDANKLKALMEGKTESSAPPGLKPGEKPKPANTGVRKFYQKNIEKENLFKLTLLWTKVWSFYA